MGGGGNNVLENCRILSYGYKHVEYWGCHLHIQRKCFFFILENPSISVFSAMLSPFCSQNHRRLLFLPLVSGSGAFPRLPWVSTRPGCSGLHLPAGLSPLYSVLPPLSPTLSPNVGTILFLLLQRGETTWW